MNRSLILFRRLALPLALFIVVQALLVAAPLAPQVAAQGPVDGVPNEVAPTPLESVLNADGSLQAGVELNGSVDTSGWQMSIDADGAPRFVRAGGEQVD